MHDHIVSFINNFALLHITDILSFSYLNSFFEDWLQRSPSVYVFSWWNKVWFQFRTKNEYIADEKKCLWFAFCNIYWWNLHFCMYLKLLEIHMRLYDHCLNLCLLLMIRISAKFFYRIYVGRYCSMEWGAICEQCKAVRQ